VILKKVAVAAQREAEIAAETEMIGDN